MRSKRSTCLSTIETDERMKEEWRALNQNKEAPMGTLETFGTQEWPEAPVEMGAVV